VVRDLLPEHREELNVEDSHHDQIAKWERRWIAASGLMTLMFVILIAYSLATEGAHIAQSAARGTPQQLLAQPLFVEPGVRVVGPGQVEVSLVGQAFNWQPETIRVPVGAEVTFYLTARDVIHGWQVEDTNLNVEVIPGEVSRLRTSFDRVGRYRVSCNEYCGIGHQNMIGWIDVVPSSLLDAPPPLEAAAAPGVEGDAGAGPDGAAVYATSCASCHGAQGAGIRGAFPPLAGHAAELAALEGGPDYLINVLLYGLQGPIQVDGANYAGLMPAWANLADGQIAAVLDFIVDLGGDSDVEFTAEAVAERRGAGLSADDVHELRETVVGP
jgi:cytochrome c oxidase subunit II